ncbi:MULTISPECIES: hypothetical protein [unclassified Streptomyces]|uniref:hypothetical protein n=1 Tax=unclassified Streptomyces TaxID=2593676 RepID=UPI0035DD3A4F
MPIRAASYFSVVQRKVVSPNDFTDLAQVGDRLQAFEDRYNATAQPFQWKGVLTHGHALQLHAAHRGFLAAPAAHTPLLPGSGEKAFNDVDSTRERVYGRAKQGAE